MAFRKKLDEFLQSYLEQKMPRLDFKPQHGGIPKEEKLKRIVENLLDNDGYDAVIALTDVYTGKPDFKNATDAKNKMMGWVQHNPKFYPHTALHDFEAWLLPYWTTTPFPVEDDLLLLFSSFVSYPTGTATPTASSRFNNSIFFQWDRSI